MLNNFLTYLQKNTRSKQLKDLHFFWTKYKVTVIRSARRHHSISVQIDTTSNTDKALSIRCPSSYSRQNIISFLNDRKVQIDKLQRRTRPPALLRSGATILFKGKEYQLNIITIPPTRPPLTNSPTNTFSKTFTKSLIFSDKQITIYLPTNTPPQQTPIITKNILNKSFKMLARQHLTARTDYWSLQMNLKFNQIRIKDTKTRWGSCSSKGNLNYKWQIIMATLPIIDYLVIHEVSHLKHGNHSVNFWNLVERYDPQYKKHRLWLRKSGWKLQI